MRTRTSPGSGSGSRRRSTRTSPGPWRIAAFLADNLLDGPRSGNLRGRVAAVEEERLAGHEVGAGRRQIDRQRSDLLGPPDASRRNVAGQALVDRRVGERLVGHVG